MVQDSAAFDEAAAAQAGAATEADARLQVAVRADGAIGGDQDGLRRFQRDFSAADGVSV